MGCAMSHKGRVDVQPYDPTWPTLFDAEAVRVQRALSDNCVAIHPVGSTAVPGLVAKPKIDIIAVVRHLCFDPEPLQAIGYTYRGGFNIPLRKSFTMRTVDRNINLHVFEENDPEIELNLLFRDYLRDNPSVRNDYALLKYKLIAEDSNHEKNDSIYRGYTLGKNDFIQTVVKKSGFDKHRCVLCTHYAEWDAAKQFRHRFFFGPRGIKDGDTWTFNHKDHAHCVLYCGVDIVAYVHIQFLPDHRSVIRILGIDTHDHRGARVLMAYIDRWLKNIGVKSIHGAASQHNLRLYRDNGYTTMAFHEFDHHEHEFNDVPVGKIL